MSNELLVALSIGLLPISALNLWHAIRYQYYRRNDEDEISSFVWGLLCWQIAIFMSCVLYLLWDFDIIYKSTQYKLSVMPRCFFLIGSIFFYQGLNRDLEDRNLAIAAVLSVIMIVFCAKVVI
jgi:hypothetical protein